MPKPLTAIFALAILALAVSPPTACAREKDEPKTTTEKKTDAKPADRKSAEKKPEQKPKKVRLAKIVIEGGLPESAGELSLFGELGSDLRKTVARLDKAASDDSISGVILEIHNDLTRGKLNELRAAIGRIQAAGKKVHAQLESAEGAQYLLATACDEIVMPESGMVMISGIRGEFAFYKELLAKLGVQADMIHVGDYKGAAEAYMRDSLSEPVRKNLTAMIDDLFDQMITTIAADRHLQADDVKAAIDRGLLTASEAKAAGLVDRLEYPDQTRDRLAKQYHGDKLVYVVNYAKKKVDTDFSGPMGMMKLFNAMLGGSEKRGDSQPKIAIVYAVGPIMSGKSESDLLGDSSMGSTTIVKAINEAAEDDTVKAIVLRVNSPGGSALASDLIWRATQATDKPIVASMGDVAASGGYYIAMGCDQIFAEPGTVTGSIGVVGGKIALGGLFKKIGVDTESISRGKNSGIFSTTEKFSDSERKTIQAMMQSTYEQFTSKAAAGRKMDPAELEKLAGGQVFTGRVAKRNGLVDELGTLKDAVQAARLLAGLTPDEKVEMKLLPEPQNPLDALFGVDTDSEREAGLESRLLSRLLKSHPAIATPLRQVLQLERIFQEPVAAMMPFTLEIK